MDRVRLIAEVLALLAVLAFFCYSLRMATIVIRNLDEKVKRALQVRAALNGRSMEAEVRAFLSEGLGKLPSPSEPEEDLETAIHKRFAALGGVDPEIPPREFSAHTIQGFEPDAPENPELKDGLGTAIHRLFAPFGGVELEIPPRRKSHRPIPTFE